MALINRKTTSSPSTLPDEHQNSLITTTASPFIAKRTSLSPVTFSRRDNFPKGLRGGGGLVIEVCCQFCGQCLVQNLSQICAGGNCPQCCQQCCSQCCPPNCKQECPQWCPHWCQQHGQICCRLICCAFSKTSKDPKITQSKPSTIQQNPVTVQPGATS